MTVETIEREDGKAWYKIVYGYGRLLRINAIYAENVPDGAKRAMVSNPDIDEREFVSKMSTEEIATFNARTGPAIIAVVLHSAHDWDGQDAAKYVDESLPADVAAEILTRVRSALAGEPQSQTAKKNSP